VIILGVILAVLGYWIFPDLVPEVPYRLDTLCGGIGVLLIILGIILWILGVFGRPVGGRRFWY
jgi:multisubunit Na+/H+ antiporter MnhG subunit